MIRRLPIALALAGAIVLGASAAQASSDPPNEGGRTPTTAVTNFSPRQIAGGRGTWAQTQKYTLTVTIVGGGSVPLPQCGPAAPDCYRFVGHGTVTGTWTSITRAFTPRTVAGLRITGVVHGKVTGTLTWTFNASGYPYRKLVPGNVTGGDLALWPERFFGAGTRFGGVALTQQSYIYSADGCPQKWTVSAATNNGQDKTAGNIRGGQTCQ